MIFKVLTYLFIGTYGISCSFAQSFDSRGQRRFIAAGKGDSPPCNVQPGQTYCEDIQNYPYELVLNAIKKTTDYDVRKFLVDESRDDGPNFEPAYTDSGLSKRKIGPTYPFNTHRQPNILGAARYARQIPIHDKQIYSQIRRYLRIPA